MEKIPVCHEFVVNKIEREKREGEHKYTVITPKTAIGKTNMSTMTMIMLYVIKQLQTKSAREGEREKVQVYE